jgi:hypothetical protein
VRGWPSPRALFVAGSALLLVSIVGAVWFGGMRARRGVTTPTVTTSPVPPPEPAFSISTVGAAVSGPFSTTVTWRTTAASTGQVAWGPAAMRSLLWSSSPTPALVHQVVLAGLSSNTAYVASIEARSQTGAVASARLPFTTASSPSDGVGATRAGAVLVNGAPFFPLITWQECASQWAPDIADGINLFAGNPCTGLSSLLSTVQGRALATGTTDDTPLASGPGLLGWFYPDEADARGLTGLSLTPAGSGLRFLTLTAHFFPGAAPLPTGRGMYTGLLAKADVVGFDLYPLQELCRPELLPWVFDAQQELARRAAPKPTFQWIEVREMKCAAPASAVTQQTIRVESWLAIAGGAHGLGFFPNDWGTTVGMTLRGIAARIRQLEPALLQPALAVGIDPPYPAVRASARELGGALYVIAVNAGPHVAAVRLHAPGLAGRPLQIVGRRQSVPSHRSDFVAVLPPMSARIYTASPTGVG